MWRGENSNKLPALILDEVGVAWTLRPCLSTAHDKTRLERKMTKRENSDFLRKVGWPQRRQMGFSRVSVQFSSCVLKFELDLVEWEEVRKVQVSEYFGTTVRWGTGYRGKRAAWRETWPGKPTLPSFSQLMCEFPSCSQNMTNFHFETGAAGIDHMPEQMGIKTFPGRGHESKCFESETSSVDILITHTKILTQLTCAAASVASSLSRMWLMLVELAVRRVLPVCEGCSGQRAASMRFHRNQSTNTA